jgi:hypothetical protein
VGISGLTAPSPISITEGEYSIGCTASFTSTPGTINAGQGVCVRQSASVAYDTLTTATLTIGGVSGAFHVMTAAGPGFATTRRVVGSYYSSFGLRSDGVLFGWGYNVNGQLLTPGGSYVVYTPAQVTMISGVIDVASGGTGTNGYYFSLVARSDGTVWQWGLGYSGLITGFTGAVAVAAGANHSLALKSDGTVGPASTGAAAGRRHLTAHASGAWQASVA